MKPVHTLRVYQLARQNLRDLAALAPAGFGDLTNQIRRSAISVVSNICECCGCSSGRERKRFLGFARASNAELLGQLAILADLGLLGQDHPLQDQVDHVGSMLYRLQTRVH